MCDGHPGSSQHRPLGPGIDFKTSTGYAVMPRSIHPDSGKPYVRVDGPIPAPPDWFIDLVTVIPSAAAPQAVDCLLGHLIC